MRLRPVTPRAMRSAVITASVPEFTSRTRSRHGTSEQSRSAKRTSSSVLMPNVVPSAACS
jgi:hypothetical protein